MSEHNIKNFADLKREQAILKGEVAQKEKELSDSWQYVSIHFKKIVWNSINPFKNESITNKVLDFLKPSLLPLLGEVALGTAKGKPINAKVLLSAAKFAMANLGINWLSKWLEKNVDTEPQEEE